MLSQKEIWSLMARSIFGEATPEEQETLQKFLQDYPGLQQQYGLLASSLKNTSPATRADEAADVKSEVQHIIEKAEQQKKTVTIKVLRLRRYIPLAAASIILLIITGWFLINRDGSPATIFKKPAPVFATENGSRRHVVLPDGTKVSLNSGSKLFYNNNFKGAVREVTLEGEAFFDVVKKTGQPFIVHANNINIKVLGTAFNVKAYQDDENVETTLYRGLVNITKDDDKSFRPIMLYPNQKIIVPKEVLHNDSNEDLKIATGTAIRKSIVIQQIDSTKIEPQRIETAWMYNRLEFRGDDFLPLARKLERWYNVKIVFEDEKVKQLSFNGSFEKETIEQALLALSTANHFNYKIKGHEVLISSSK